MKVHELIDLLEQADQNANVVIDESVRVLPVDGIAWDRKVGDIVIAICTNEALPLYERQITPDTLRRTNDAIMGVLAGEEELEHSTRHDDPNIVDGSFTVVSTVEL